MVALNLQEHCRETPVVSTPPVKEETSVKKYVVMLPEEQVLMRQSREERRM